ncbi:MAG: hypothetical protein LBN08_06660 [Lactobacillales bacterium]|jgi:hypothetical protein|nr:hypothetical protein [Lactobacillales bacterium]
MLNWLRKEIEIGNSKIKPEQGVITIMAIVIIVPTILFAALMVETARYFAMANETDVALQATGNDVLTGYDKYTYEKFGVMTVDQSQNMQKTVEKDQSGSCWQFFGEIDSIMIQGSNPLSDFGAVETQMAGFSEYNGLGAVFNKFVKLDKLFKMIDDFAGENGAKLLGQTFADEGKTLDSLNGEVANVMKLADSVTAQKNQYDTLFKEWADAVETATGEIATAQSNTEDSETDIADSVKAAQDKITEAYDNYVNWHTTTDTLINNYISGIKAFDTALADYSDASLDAVDTLQLNGLDEQIDQFQSELDMSDSIVHDEEHYSAEDRAIAQAEFDRVTPLKEAAEAQRTEVLNRTREAAQGLPEQVTIDLEEIDHDIKQEKANLGKLKPKDVAADTPRPDDATYHFVDFTNCLESGAFLNVLKNCASAQLSPSNTGKNILSKMDSIFDGLSDLSIFADPRLNAKINTNYYDKIKSLTGNNLEHDGIFEIIGAVLQIMKTPGLILGHLLHGDIIHALLDLADFFIAIADFFKGIFDMIMNFAERIAQVVTGRFDKVLQVPYWSFNFANRTNRKHTLGSSDDDLTGKSVSGFEFTKNRSTPSDVDREYGCGSLSGLLDSAIGPCESGDDYAFCSCELEYIFTGRSNEIQAQEYTFLAIFVFRLLPNIAAVSADKIISELALEPIVGQIIQIVALFLESFVDTFLLVNGASLKLVGKDKCFVASDCVNFLDKLAKIEGETKFKADAVRDALKTSLDEGDPRGGPTSGSNAFEEYLAKSWLEFDYSQHIFIMMLLFGNNSQYTKRTRDLIEMEGTLNKAYDYYGDLGSRSDIADKVTELYDSGKAYDITKAYTRVRVRANYKTCFKIFSLGKSKHSVLDKYTGREVNVGY